MFVISCPSFTYRGVFIRRVLLVLLFCVVLTACGGSDSSTGTHPTDDTLNLSGAFALYPLAVRWSNLYQEITPNVRFNVSAGGAGKGMTDVLNGLVDLAMVSREIRPEEIEQGAFPVAVARDAVVFTVNEDNPVISELTVRGASADRLALIWLSEDPGTWAEWLGSASDQEDWAIHPYTRADASGAGEIAAKYLGANAQEMLHGIAVQGDPGVLEAVRKDPLGIGYNNIAFAFDPVSGLPIDGISIVALDLNDNGKLDAEENFYANRAQIVRAIADGTYPAPPSRTLYLVTKGPPSEEVKSFLNWLLKDGQKVVPEVGYVQLPQDLLEENLDRIK